jgi:hypothetical protein
MSAHRVFRSGRLKPRAFLLPALIGVGTASSLATAATLASTSFQGSGLAYTLTGEFDANGSGFTDFFKVLPNNATRVDSVIIPSGIFAGGDGTQCLMTEDTDHPLATVPGTVTFAAVTLTGHTNIRLDVLLAATGVQGNALASPRGFETGDRIKIEASVDGAAFQTLASFVPEAGGFNTYLSRDTDGNGTGDAGSPTAANAVEQAFKNFSFPLPNGGSVIVRIEVMGNATGEYIAIDNVRILGDPVGSAAPVLAGMTATALNYTEGDAATVIAPALTVSDTDSANLTSAEIAISGNYTAPEDALVYTPINGVTVLSNAGGVLTLTGNRPLSDYQAALRTVRYQNANITNPNTAQRTLTFRVNDGSNFSNSPFRNVNVINTLVSQTIPYTEHFDDALGTGHRYGVAGGFDLGPDDFFARITAAENAARFGVAFTGVVGAGFFGSEGINANGIGEGAVTLSLNSANYGNLAVNILLAAESVPPSFESTDYLVVEYQFGGAGPFLPLIQFRATGEASSTLAVDTNNDGVGDGTVLTPALTNFNLPIPATGAGLLVRVRAATTSLEEQIAFDEFGVTGNIASVPPVVSGLSGAPFAYTEGAVPVILGAGITITDVDDTNMESAVVSFSGNFAAGQDVLAVTTASGITSTYDGNTGVLSLSGTASKAAYAGVLATLSYRNSDLRHPSELTRSIIVRVNDGDSNSNNGLITVNVTDVVPRLPMPFCETFSTDGRGTRFRAVNFFEQSADNVFNRSILPRAGGSLTGAGGADPFAWVAEDTDAIAGGPSTLAFDLNTTGYSNLLLTLDLAAAPNQFDSPDQILVEQSVNGGSFAVVAAFRPNGTNTNLSRDANNDGTGDGSVVLGNGFTSHTFPLTSGPNSVIRFTVHASGTSEEIAIGTVCITGTPATPHNNGNFFTAPFGPGGTWNLYEVVGTGTGVPATWYDAEVAASTKPNLFGAGIAVGHLPTLESREEGYTLSYLAGMQTIWLGLTDDHFVFGGTESNTDPVNGWVWTSRLSSTYRAWAGGEPNNSGGLEDAVQLFGAGIWNDIPAGIPEAPAAPGQVIQPYVIEWNLAAAAPIPGVPVAGPVLPADLDGPTGGTGTFGVLAVRDNGALSHIRAGVDSVMSGTGTRLTGTTAAINHVDPEAPNRGIFLSDATILANTAAVDENNVHVYKGLIRVQTAGTYTFAVNADDSFALRIRGAAWSGVNGGYVMIDHLSPGDTMFVDQLAYSATSFGRVDLAVGLYYLDFVAHQDSGSSGHEVMVARGGHSSLADTPDWRRVGHVSAGTIGRPGVQATGYTVITSAPNGSAITNLSSAQTQITATGTTSTHSAINFADPESPGGGGSISPSNPFARNTGIDDDNFAVQVDATLSIPVEGDYIFGFRSDDGSSLQITGQSWLGIVDSVDGISVIAGDTLKYDQNTGDSFTRAKIHLTAGTHTLRGVYWENGGGAHYELFGDSALNPQTRLLEAGAAQSYADPDGLMLIVPPRIHHSPYNADHTFELAWDTTPGVSYYVEYAFDLPNWNPWIGPFTATGPTYSVHVGALAPYPRFYFRVRTE